MRNGWGSWRRVLSIGLNPIFAADVAFFCVRTGLWIEQGGGTWLRSGVGRISGENWFWRRRGWIVLALVVGFLGFTLKKNFFDPFFPITNPRAYPEALAHLERESPEAARIFPRSIPKEAREVEFHYDPSFLQGSFIVSLRFRVSPAVLAALKEELEASGRKVVWRAQFRKMREIPPLNAEERGLLNASLLEVSDDSELFLFKLPPEGSPKKGKIIGFTAISAPRNVVAYYFIRE